MNLDKKDFFSLREVARYLIKAQVASDSGKSFSTGRNNKNRPESAGYSLKDLYIAQAVQAAEQCNLVKVSRGFDQKLQMDIVYFDIQDFGQMSFHSYRKWSKLPFGGKWNGIKGGSVKVARLLSKRLKLNLYK